MCQLRRDRGREVSQLLKDLREVRASVASGATLNSVLRSKAAAWSKERGLRVCRAIDAVEEELALLDAAIAKANQ